MDETALELHDTLLITVEVLLTGHSDSNEELGLELASKRGIGLHLHAINEKPPDSTKELGRITVPNFIFTGVDRLGHRLAPFADCMCIV